jgi:DNA-binding MarR family transcriptional regulator
MLDPAPADHGAHVHVTDASNESLDPSNAWRHALRLAAGFETYVAQLRGELGISSNEMNALLLLWDGGPCTMTRLADRIALSRPALTSLVDRLELDGWVERASDPRDRRQVLVRLTDRFERELVEGSHAWRQRLQNHASATSVWGDVVMHVARIREVSTTSARELRDARRLAWSQARVTRPAP